MLEKYKTVYEGGEGEIVEKKSRFIATVRPVPVSYTHLLIRSIQKIGERQKIPGYGEEDKDIIAVAMDESLDLREQDAVVQVFFVRGGKLIGREHFYLRVARGDTKAQVLSSFMKQFYAGTPFIPREIMLQKEIEDAKIIEEWLTDRRKQRVYIRVPKKGTKEKLVCLLYTSHLQLYTETRQSSRSQKSARKDSAQIHMDGQNPCLSRS